MRQNIKEQELNAEIYQGTTEPKKYLFFFASVLLGSLLLSLPWERIFTIPSLAQMVGCPIQSAPWTLHFFPPGPATKSLSLPTQCTGLARNITMDNVSTTLGGLSFSPFGPVINASGTWEGTPLRLKLALGITDQTISFYHEKFPLAQLSKFFKEQFQLPIILSGSAKTDVRVSLDNQALDEHTVDISSQDLNLPAQTIALFQIPELALNKLLIKIQGKGNRAVIEDLTIGDDTSLFLHVTGNFTLNQQQPNESNLNLNVELKLAPSLQQQFALLDTFLAQQKKAPGHYQFKLEGSAGAPSIR